jgi:hypothetical protein
LEQIQFLLGHVSVQTTERYLGCKQAFDQQSMIALASSRILELAVLEGWPTILPERGHHIPEAVLGYPGRSFTRGG